MKKRYLSFLKRILVSALSLSMIIQPVSPVVAAEAGSEAIEIGSSEEELSGAAESAGAAAQQTDEAQVVTDASSAVESSVDDAAVDDARYEDVNDAESMDVASGEEEVVEDDTEPVEEEESSEEEAVTTAAEEDSDKAFVAHVYDVTKEAEEYEGPSVVIAYTPCQSHGIRIGMQRVQEEMKRAVESGYWLLYRYDPRREHPFQLDSKAPSMDYTDFLDGETRYAALRRTFPQNAETLFAKGAEDAAARYEKYRKMAES